MTRWTRALVTGASSGIGEAIARQLAAENTRLVVVARDTGRLEALATELGGDVEVLTADLSTAAGVDAVADRLRDGERPVDLLVNNAGFGFTGEFSTLDLTDEQRVIAVNVAALHALCHAAAGAMTGRGEGAILNISSVAAFFPTGGNATYAATKAFVTSFSDSLHQELKVRGVTVTSSCPGFTRTEFQERAGYDASEIPGILWQSADDVARDALDATAAGKAQAIPGLKNKVGAFAFRHVPRGLIRRVGGFDPEAW
ncbi:MAG: SDR family oxidoreductase [Actinomycetota bacterium]